MTPLQDAAQRARLRFAEQQPSVLGEVDRLTIDVVQGLEREMVSLRLVGGELTWSCSCGQRDCAHAATALALLATPAARSTVGSQPPALGEGAKGSLLSLPPVASELSAFAEALEDVVTAVVRTGVGTAAAPSVAESIERLVAASPSPLPVGTNRWIGRLQLALSEKNADFAARLLDGATRIVDDLKSGVVEDKGRMRIVSWVGALADYKSAVYAISDRTMLELGRERLDGVSRAVVERRHVLDLGSGQIYVEEGATGKSGMSLGTCPRLIHVGLAEVERGASPQRIRFLQYASSPLVHHSHFQEATNWATRAFATLLDTYKDALSDFPGVAEPVALIGIEHLARSGEALFADDGRHKLPLFGGQSGNLDALEQHIADDPIEFLYGRLVDRGEALHLRPIACAVNREGHRIEHLRL